MVSRLVWYYSNAGQTTPKTMSLGLSQVSATTSSCVLAGQAIFVLTLIVGDGGASLYRASDAVEGQVCSEQHSSLPNCKARQVSC